MCFDSTTDVILISDVPLSVVFVKSKRDMSARPPEPSLERPRAAMSAAHWDTRKMSWWADVRTNGADRAGSEAGGAKGLIEMDDAFSQERRPAPEKFKVATWSPTLSR